MVTQTAPDHPAPVPALRLPAASYRRTAHRTPKEQPKGLDAGVDRCVGLWRRRGGVASGLLAEAALAGRLTDELRAFPDRRLQDLLRELREAFRRGGRSVTPEVVRRALAAVREAADRKLGLRPFDVQVAGALALHRGLLAEMATGEGKTLTAGLTAILLGWTGKACHVVTVNDYLAARDAERLKPLYHFCGLRVGAVTGPMDAGERRAGYGADVTYTTSKEVVADFLRDRLQLGPLQDASRRHLQHLVAPRWTPEAGLVMRGLSAAIVDEADSVLIDEAVTPLIISRAVPNPDLEEACRVASRFAGEFRRDEDYSVDARLRHVEFRDAGYRRLGAIDGRGLPGIWRGPHRRMELVRQALAARELFHRDAQYVVLDGKVVIVDEFTGRMMPGRTWREGLHQAVEAKEGIEVTAPSETLARISFQRFFRLYERLSGMTGTASEAADEFWRIYRLPVVRIPTHRPCVREVRPDRVFADAGAKWEAVADGIADLHARGVPVLAGTRLIRASEELARRLSARGLEFRLLHAIHHREEAQIVAEAGLPGRITIATNMAGRGTDIRLGDGVAGLGGLRVVATERHESLRIDRQLFGRCARQGDPGEVHVFVSMEDELVRRFVPGAAREAIVRALRAGLPGARAAALAAFRHAQTEAQRQAYRQRREVLRMDTWIDDALSFAGGYRYM